MLHPIVSSYRNAATCAAAWLDGSSDTARGTSQSFRPNGIRRDSLRRITYEPADGRRPASGVEAIARALEHIHLGWAVFGFLVRLPIVCQVAQLLADASGAEPRRIRTTT
jgi:hypothetical protein